MKSLFVCNIAFLLLLVGFMGITHHKVPVRTSSYSIRTITNVAYGPKPSEVLDECLPIGAPSQRPAVIMIHGGGWAGGGKGQWEALCQTYAQNGYDAFTIDYRLTELSTIVAPWPDQIGDVQLAVRYIRSIATTINLDPRRICSFGDSAGAHLALLLDTVQTIDQSDVSYLYPTISPTVLCVADLFGPAELTRLYNEVPNDRQKLEALLGGQTPTSDPAIYADASPVSYIDSDSGQALIVQGTKDTTVPPDQSQLVQTDMQNAHVPVQYISYDGGHEFLGLTQTEVDAIFAQIASWYAKMLHP
ncbi:MAG TPA: alpha/beta hydrolase [Ktedonobacteraceae bacterium]|jgi:acetyl esterase/lipase|nr:alpha/beta hydrolase [Ktedonobacteraceae bacterium]